MTSVCTTALILQEEVCVPRDLTVNQKVYDKALYFNFLCSDLYPSSSPSCGSWNRQVTFLWSKAAQN